MKFPLAAASANRVPLSDMLHALAQDGSRERISVGDLLEALGDRALAALLFVFAFPNVLPVPPGTSALLGTPLIFLAAQLALGRAPWLPSLIARRSMSRADFAILVRRISPWLKRAERLLRPRLPMLTRPWMECGVGVVCLLLALIVVLPIPLGNMLPALAISLLALGVLERDGLWVAAGVATAGAAMAVVSGMVFAMAKAALYLVAELLS